MNLISLQLINTIKFKFIRNNVKTIINIFIYIKNKRINVEAVFLYRTIYILFSKINYGIQLFKHFKILKSIHIVKIKFLIFLILHELK